MLIPIVVSSVFVVAVVILCLIKPNAGRIFLGLFFLSMALGVNGFFTFTNPQGYVDYADGALIPLYRDLALTIIELSPVGFGLLLMAFEITMGLLIGQTYLLTNEFETSFLETLQTRLSSRSS